MVAKSIYMISDVDFISGIGPREKLQELQIPLIQDLQVGQKMYDHITFAGLTYTVNESIVVTPEEILSPTSLLRFLKRSDGVLTSTGIVEAFTYIKTTESKDKKKNYPDIEIIFIGGSFSTDYGALFRKTFAITDEMYNKVWKPLHGKYAVTLFPMLLHPKSYGYIELPSKSPFSYPKFHGNYFTDSENSDIKTFIAAIREIQRIMKAPSMQRYDAKIHSIPFPGCDKLEFDSDAYWECALRHLSPTLHHQLATCKMGPNHDPEAVVDPKLRVYGVKKLRVADCSVIPMPLSAHTNAPAMMIGEKTADLLKEDWEVQVDSVIDIRSLSFTDDDDD